MKSQDWLKLLKSFETGSYKKSLFQLTVTLLLYLASMTVMMILIHFDFSVAAIMLLALPAAGFLVKLFIIMHDCGHNSFFKNETANDITGKICGLLTFTPFADWRKSHAIHHASVSNLEKRGTGDVWTMTVNEYRSASPFEKIKYRIFRNPFFLFTIAPVFMFLVLQRLPHRNIKRKELLSIIFTDFMLIIMLAALSMTAGIRTYIIAQLPVITIASLIGLWLFFVQHQFKNVYWSHSENWNRLSAAMKGSSYYKLPLILRWFSGNIGFHHIHHLDPRIPNYNLPKCYNSIPELREVKPLTVWSSLHSLFLELWDEKTGQLVNFHHLKSVY